MKTYQKMGAVLALGLGFVAVANSSPVTLYDNLSSSSVGEQGIPPGWIADAFTTGSNFGGYSLGNITLKLSGNIDGNIQGITLKLFSDIGSGVPGPTQIGHAYVNPPSVTTTPNNNVFNPNASDASLVLAANTTYWVKLDATAPRSASVNWSYTTSGFGPWAYDTLGGSPESKFNGIDGPFLMKVEANSILLPRAPSPIPIPAAAWLMGSGLIGLVSSWRKKTSVLFS